jgi:hypothetical protein
MEPQEYQEVWRAAEKRKKNETWTRRRSYQHKLRQHQRVSLLVPPVMHDGPVLRRDVTTDSTKRPTQSACLYIHGAFPVGPARNSRT